MTDISFGVKRSEVIFWGHFSCILAAHPWSCSLCVFTFSLMLTNRNINIVFRVIHATAQSSRARMGLFSWLGVDHVGGSTADPQAPGTLPRMHWGTVRAKVLWTSCVDVWIWTQIRGWLQWKQWDILGWQTDGTVGNYNSRILLHITRQLLYLVANLISMPTTTTTLHLRPNCRRLSAPFQTQLCRQ